MLDISIRIKTLRISFSLVEYIGTTPGKYTNSLILKFIEKALFLNEIYFSSSYMPTENICKFFVVVSWCFTMNRLKIKLIMLKDESVGSISALQLIKLQLKGD